MKWLTLILLNFLVLTLASCGGKNDGETSYNLPPLYISCNQGFANDCRTANTGKTFYVGISSDTSIDCELELAKVTNANLNLFFEFNGSSTTTYSGEMEGAITQWYDTENQQTLYMQNIDYKACSFIDVDDDGKLDPTEAVGELLFDANDNFPTIIDWQ